MTMPLDNFDERWDSLACKFVAWIYACRKSRRTPHPILDTSEAHAMLEESTPLFACGMTHAIMLISDALAALDDVSLHRFIKGTRENPNEIDARLLDLIMKGA